MTLTIRIEDGSPEYENLQQVKEIFSETSATKAIFAALNYAKERKLVEQQVFLLSDKLREEKNRTETLLRKMQMYFDTEQWFRDQILTL